MAGVQGQVLVLVWEPQTHCYASCLTCEEYSQGQTKTWILEQMPAEQHIPELLVDTEKAEVDDAGNSCHILDNREVALADVLVGEVLQEVE